MLSVDVAVSEPQWTAALADAPARAETAVRAALAASPHAALLTTARAAEVSLMLAGDDAVADLNQRYRGKAGPTNVLSFPGADAGQLAAADGAPLALGDIVLAFETVAREARAQGKSLADHFTHLAVHGVLHLIGYDHMEPGEAAAMERLERRVLAGLGVADPYDDGPQPAKEARS